MPYGALSLNFIERKESLVYIRIFRFFLFSLLKFGPTCLKSTLEDFSDCSYGHINSIAIGLSYRLVHIRTVICF
jgi:hypothetical protein